MPRNEYDEKMQALRRKAQDVAEREASYGGRRVTSPLKDPAPYDTSQDRFSQPATRAVREDVAAQPQLLPRTAFELLTDAEKEKLREEQEARLQQARRSDPSDTE